jgi:SPP1 gp7 family putative phage head morphogenesis protein
VGATEDMKAGMLRVMSEGIQQNKGTLEIARNMSNEVTDIGKKRAILIARTEISKSYNSAISKTYQTAGIEKWQWLAAMGENTCDICADRHGEVFNWGDAQPPEHPRCLCTIYPVVDVEFKR